MNAVAEVLRRLGDQLGVSVAVVPIGAEGRAGNRTAGLSAATDALRAAGCRSPAIAGHADDGRPLWPDGFTGSIAHAGALAVATACRVGAVVAAGIDIALDATLPAADALTVLDHHENAWVAAEANADHRATLVWSAKESAFKAWSTATHGGLGRVDPVDVHVDVDDDTLTVTARGQLLPAISAVGPLQGAHATADGYVVTLVTARARSLAVG